MRKTLLIIGLIGLSFSKHTTENKGTATYYGQHYTGRLTASGERFHKDSLTAAHKTFKFGTILRVKNLLNDSVRLVRVNDRLPKTSRHILDLSYGSAKELNFLKQGVIPISIEVVNSNLNKK